MIAEIVASVQNVPAEAVGFGSLVLFWLRMEQRVSRLESKLSKLPCGENAQPPQFVHTGKKMPVNKRWEKGRFG